jgi:type II secretory pathway pseudopilin PulG
MNHGSPSSPARRAFSKRSGFTIIEVAMAATVMVLAISSALIVMQAGFRSLDTARKTTIAAQIIQSEMERVRMLSWTRVEALMTADPGINLETIFPRNTDLERKVFAQMEDTFTATRTITPLADYANEVVVITVTVSWKGIDGTAHTRSTHTRYCKNGLYNYYYTLAS